ncbi:diguanylate cyclase domain-containing protein, partial [Planktomarina temperata]|uniref:diguanylate cyclase domain-containing protein n=1 Tax=Planktomarina temperata TaxID=1284658 RepID=UPI003C78F304
MGFNTSIMTLIFHVLFLVLLLVALAFLLYMLHRGRVERRKMRRLIDRLRLSNSKLSRYVDLDDLTAAQSRRYLVDRIDRHKRRETHALLYVDLDEFKTVNDTYGHDVGDALLIKVTDAMVAACRPGDFVARLGGDEFCVFLKGCDLERAGQVARRFLQAVVEADVEVAGRRVIRTASIGVCELRPDQSMEDALNVADAALYEAKSKGKNQILATDQDVVLRMRQKQSRPSAEEVGAALENGEITYFVQPIFDLEQDRIEGVEALIRWVKPDGEILLPGQFLDLMADSYKRGVRPPLEEANAAAIGFSKLDPPIYCGWNISSKFLNNTVLPGADAEWLKALLNGLPPEMT